MENKQTAPVATEVDDLRRQLQMARQAIAHTLNTIARDPEWFWLMGEGTESYAQLTAAHAALHGRSVEDIRRTFRPNFNLYNQYCEERKKHADLIRYCRENGIRAGGAQ